MRTLNESRASLRQFLTAALLVPLCASAQISIKNTGRELVLSERGRSILLYRYRAGDRGDGIPAQAGYIDTLWGPYGNILTPESPAPGRPFSGVFWSWPRVEAGGESYGPGEEHGATRIFERWLEVSATKELATIGAQYAWVRNTDGRAIVMETQGIEIFPADSRNRAIDLYLRLTNVFDEAIAFSASQGRAPLGLTVQVAKTPGRPTLTTSPVRVPAGAGTAIPEWIDLSYRAPRSSRSAGVALFKHPFEPGGLRLRHVSTTELSIQAALPVGADLRLEPGKFLELRLRLYVHTGSGIESKLEIVAERYAAELENSQP